MTSQLLAWFQQEKRVLPWRNNQLPYRRWVSEIMLQQTKVRSVIPYFNRWLEHFPNVTVLAQASYDDVLKQWEGLGYYRRAKHLHEAAKVIAFEYGGTFPKHYADWIKLPGIGSYTAAALASRVNNEAVLAVDGNVKRVAARVFSLKGIVREKEVKQALEPFISKTQPGDFNEALIELGATLCKKASPQCPKCPIHEVCQAHLHDQVKDFPFPKAKKTRPHHHRYALVNMHMGKLWLRQRGETEMLNGLWGFVLYDSPPKGHALEDVEHAYTHFSLTVTPVLSSKTAQEGSFIAIDKLTSLALSGLDHKILAVLSKQDLV